MILFVFSVFISAFLLFEVQPMISRFILPFFGGTPAVWSTVQLFFQVFLTGGYAYAYWLISRISTKKQTWMHISLLVISLSLVVAFGFLWPSPITPDASWKPTSVATPIQDIFKLLLVSVGLPFFLLSTNSPLMQAWFARALPERSPYWLYALSNIGSLLGLLTYPFVIEPNLTLRTQGWMWSGGYLLFALLAGYASFRSTRTTMMMPEMQHTVETTPSSRIPSRQSLALWLLFSALGTTLLLAVTSQITQEVAAIPLLWVLPLSIYLLSFILVYSNERWYSRKIFGGLMILASIGFLWALVSVDANFIARSAAYCFFLFVSVMICTGETYRLRPDPSHLTRFYLMTSIGGALGGIFVTLIAPLIFKGYWELIIAFGLVLALEMALFVTRKSKNQDLQIRFIFNIMLSLTMLLVGSFSLYGLLGRNSYGDVFQGRNFYGVVRVKEVFPNDPEWQGYNVSHGVTIHGLQFTAADKRDLPTTYYARQSGIGLAMMNYPKYGQRMRVGILGLGIGTLTAYSQPGDDYRLYEINPIMVDLAEGQGGYFSYLADSQANISVILGDARLSLENELAAHGSNNFDMLVIDVFSSDSVPVHLITKEAFDIYLKHLAPNGILAANISTRYLDLIPVMWQLSKFYHLNMVVIPTESNGDRMVSPSLWVLMSRSPEEFMNPAIAERVFPMQGYSTKIPLWTDDYSNLFQILR
jgi:spermidine synthase